MTPPAPPGPDGLRPELLAAYADGELDPDTRAAVERWLADHPQARDELLAQRQLSPANWPLWQKAEPPLPSPDAWMGVRDAILDAVLNPPVAPAEPAVRRWRRVGAWLAGGLTAAAAAAAVVWVALRPPAAPAPNLALPPDVVKVVPAPPPAPPEDPLAEFDVIPIATADDVDLQRVAGADDAAYPVGTPPLAGPVILASQEDVELESVDNHPGWPPGGAVSVPTPGDAPMIFVPKPR
jgi:hypothetical protein